MDGYRLIWLFLALATVIAALVLWLSVEDLNVMTGGLAPQISN
jgi:hypothetical protein